MNNKINVAGKEYIKLGNIKLNNREYVFALLGNNLDFFEQIEKEGVTEFIELNKDLTLSGNAGTSLTRLNERILLTNIASSLENDIRSRKISSKEAIEKELELVQDVISSDAELKKMLKGNVNDLDEEKFSKRAAELTIYFNNKKRSKQSDDEFDIVEGGIDRTFINRDLYKKLEEEPIVKQAHDEELSPTVILEKLEEVQKEQILNMPPTQKEVPQSAFASIEDKLTDDVIDAVLERKKDQITENDITYLEELKKSREDEQKEEKEEVREITKDKQLVLTKPSKKAAYVDTVILCLLSQLAIFALLIFVLLLIK